MTNALVLLAGSAAAIVRLANPPQIVVKDGLVLPCTVNAVCVPDAGMLAVHVAVIAFVTLALWLALREATRPGR